jgi:1-deoxy-D-xylulose-5-phosphate synthase
MAQRYSHVVVIEDGIRHGGIGSTLAESMRDAGVEVPVHSIGIPLTFIGHAKRAEILSDLGISAQQISRSLVELRSTGELPFMAGMQRLSDETSDRSQPR